MWLRPEFHTSNREASCQAHASSPMVNRNTHAETHYPKGEKREGDTASLKI
jgi:hypothetical protein